MREEDPTSKALVFSQFQGPLDWLKGALTDEGFSHRSLLGPSPKKGEVSCGIDVLFACGTESVMLNTL